MAGGGREGGIFAGRKTFALMKHVKQEFDRLSFKEMITLGLAVVCMTAAVTATFLGMLLPPKGEVHTSILTYFGLSCAFCSALLGISAHYSSELTKFKSQITDLLADREQPENTSIK